METTISKTRGDLKYDLEDRTLEFARAIRLFVKKLPKNQVNYEDIKQLVRASGSIGANYIEANESLSKKDFVMRAKISRKEAKEAGYWLSLVDVGGDVSLDIERKDLHKESVELLKIMNAIIAKCE